LVAVCALVGFSLVAGAGRAHTFKAQDQSLFVSVSGTGHVSGSGIDCPKTCSLAYKDGSSVALTARADSGWQFAGWKGDCSGTGNCKLTMDTGHKVEADFVQQSSVDLEVSLAGQGTVSGSGIACPGMCSHTYKPGDSVALSATAASGWQFSGWAGDCSGTKTCSLTMDSAKKVDATFTQQPSPPPPPPPPTPPGQPPVTPTQGYWPGTLGGYVLQPTLPPAPPPPTVQFFSPRPAEFYDSGDGIDTLGLVNTPGGLGQFCVALDGIVYEMPLDCSEDSAVDGHGSFRVTLPHLVGGWHTVVAWVSDRYGQVASASVAIQVISPATGVDVRIQNIEVTQAIQFPYLPARGTTSETYNGVHLVGGRSTIVRVFANAASLGTGRGGRAVAAPLVVLHASRTTAATCGFCSHSIGTLAPATLTPISSPGALAGGSQVVTDAERSDPNGAYSFVLPEDWTHGTIQLRAEINPPGSAPALTECPTCAANNTLTLNGVPFDERTPIRVDPVEFTYHGTPPGGVRGTGDIRRIELDDCAAGNTGGGLRHAGRADP
jgi:hypothetical protein